MNQLEIEEFLDKLAQETESDLEAVFNKRLKAILFRISELYRKYEKDGELSFTALNDMNRFQKEMDRINKELSGDYKEIIKLLQQSMEYQYVEGYLRHAYLYEMALQEDMGFSIPSLETVKQALLNPIEFLTLPKIMEQHRNEIVRKLNISIASGIQAGKGYAEIAQDIEKELGFSQVKAMRVARTEGSRTRALAGEKASEIAEKHADLTKVWLSAADLRVRYSHRRLDGKSSDDEGYFHYGANRTTAPSLWVGPQQASLSINCRCEVIRLVNGKFPMYRRGRNYMDSSYQEKLASRIDNLMADKGLTYKKALKQAQKAIQPPSVTFEYKTYDEWYKEHA